jgi:hypothetical protein
MVVPDLLVKQRDDAIGMRRPLTGDEAIGRDLLAADGGCTRRAGRVDFMRALIALGQSG